MYFDFLLNKNDRICLAMLRQFSQLSVPTIDRQTLLTDYDITNFHLNKYFESINEDLAAVSDDQPCYLDEAVKGVFHAHHLTTYIVQKVTLMYLKRATGYPVFEFQFFYDQIQTAADYRDAHFITKPVFFRYAKQLKQAYEDEGFYDIAGVAQSEEFVIRLRLFQLYYTTFSGIEAPFPELDDSVQRLMDACVPFFSESLSPTQEVKLSTLIKIWLLRLRNQATIQAVELADNLRDETYHALFKQLQTVLPSDIALSEAEQDYVYSFLLTQGFIELNDATITAAFPLAAKITQQFVDFIKDQHFMEDTVPLNHLDLTGQLLRVNLQFTTFYVEPTTFISPNQIDFFRELYPIFDLLIRDFIKQLRQTSAFRFSPQMVVNLYFSYMFAMINTIPTEAMKDRIYVCVDFSEGVLYANYVIRSLEGFNHAHIVVQHQLTEATDIYISDFHAPKVSQPQVIWLDPPTPQDWSDLADLILAQKQARLTTLFPGHDWSES